MMYLLQGMRRMANEFRSSVMMYKKIKYFIIEKGIHNVNVIITSCYVDNDKLLKKRVDNSFFIIDPINVIKL